MLFKNSVSALFAVISAAAFVSGDEILPTGFTNCDFPGDILNISNLTLSPWPAVVGEDLTIYLEGQFNQPLVDGAAALVAVSMNNVSVYYTEFPLCDNFEDVYGTNCSDVGTAPFSVNYTIAIPSDFPPLSFNISLVAVNGDDNSTEITCLNAEVSLAANPSGPSVNTVDLGVYAPDNSSTNSDTTFANDDGLSVPAGSPLPFNS